MVRGPCSGSIQSLPLFRLSSVHVTISMNLPNKEKELNTDAVVPGARREGTWVWVAVLARAVLAFLLGLMVGGVVSTGLGPGQTFGIYALLDGLLLLWVAKRSMALHRSRAILGAAGVVTMTAGITAIVLDVVMAPVIPYMVFFSLLGSWAFFSGVVEIGSCWPLRKENGSETLILMVGLAGLVRVAYGMVTMAASTIYEDPLRAIAFSGWAAQQSTILFAFGIFYGVFAMGLTAALRNWPLRSSSPWG